MRKALRWVCFAILGSVGLFIFIGAVAQHGWPYVAFVVVVVGAAVGATRL